MASIQVEYYKDKVYGAPKPGLYIDSVNEGRYDRELLSFLSGLIRKNYLDQSNAEFKSQDHIAEDANDIYYNKEDGFWLVRSEIKTEDDTVKCVEVYKRDTSEGYVYNGYYVTPLLRAYVVKCPKVVPRFVPDEEKSLHTRFIDELRRRVNSV